MFALSLPPALHDVFPIPSGQGQHLLVNSHDRTVRLLKLSAKNIPEDNKDYLPLLREEAAARLARAPSPSSMLRPIHLEAPQLEALRPFSYFLHCLSPLPFLSFHPRHLI